MHNLIVMLPNNLGDVIMALPVLEAVKKQEPGCRITFLVEEGYEGGLIANPNCDRIVAIPRKAFKDAAASPQWRDGIVNLSRFIDGLKHDGFDTIVNLSQHPYLSYLAALLGAPETCGQRFLREGNHALPDAWSQYLYAIPFARRYNALHATDVYCRIAGVTSGGGKAAVFLHEDERKHAGRYLAEKGCVPGGDTIILQPGAAWASKRWPTESFIALGKMLIADGYRVVITGAAAERETASTIKNSLGAGCLNTAGELSFRETIAILSFARSVITGDTAIMHAAAGLGIRVVALFGPTNPVETGPYGEGHTVLAGRCLSRPCFKPDCPTRLCMQSISPETVYGCIKGFAPGNGDCDIFTTAFPEGAYCLMSHGIEVKPLYDDEGAAITRRAFGFDEDITAVTSDSPDIERSCKFNGYCRSMEEALTEYLQNRQGTALSMFGQLRQEAASIGGIADFWSALLNIRLNSLPLLDPVAGVRASIDVCRSTGEQIARSVGA